MNERNILIIGLGKVAIGYDLTSRSNGRKTHLFSIRNILEASGVPYRLFAVDVNKNARMQTKAAFPEVELFSNLSELPSVVFNIVLICVPIQLSFEVTVEVIERLNFRCLLLEKPGVATVSQAGLINSVLEKIDEAYILYPRRALPSSYYLRGILSSYEYSEFKVKIDYSGGPANILSHFVDFIEFIFEVDGLESTDLFSATTMRKTSPLNLSDHHVAIRGPISIDYSLGGENIQVRTPGLADINLDSGEEIQSQIWYTAKMYLQALSQPVILPFPSRISQNIIDILEV